MYDDAYGFALMVQRFGGRLTVVRTLVGKRPMVNLYHHINDRVLILRVSSNLQNCF